MLMLSVSIESLVGLLQYIAGSTLGIEILGESAKSYRQQLAGSYILSRVGGTFGTPNGLAMYLNMAIPVLFSTLFMRVKPWFKICSSITILLGGMTVLLTLSRAGWFSLAFGLFVAAHFIFKKILKSHLKSTALVILFFIIAGAAAISISSDVRKRLFEDTYKTADERIYMLEVAYNTIKHNPFLGVGINSYTSAMNRYDHTTRSVSYNFPYPVHNALFLFTAECGIFALTAFLILLFNILNSCILFIRYEDRFYSLLGIGFASSVFIWFIHNQFEPFPIYQNYALWIYFAFVTSLATIIKDKLRKEQ